MVLDSFGLNIKMRADIEKWIERFKGKNFLHVKLHLTLFLIFVLMNLITYLILLFSPEAELFSAIALFFVLVLIFSFFLVIYTLSGYFFDYIISYFNKKKQKKIRITLRIIFIVFALIFSIVLYFYSWIFMWMAIQVVKGVVIQS